MTQTIAVIPGDGIGKEVMPEGLRVLDAAARRHGLELRYEHHDFASCDYYLKHGAMLPDDWKARLEGVDAIFYGAVGWPATVPDHVSLWGSLLKFRREFDKYVTLRPCRLMPGIASPLVDRQGKPRPPGGIDMMIVRENTEGEYSSIGGRMFEGTEREVVVQETLMTRTGIDRVLKFAFELAAKRQRKHLTSATKSNGISITMPYWDERVEAMAGQYPQINVDKFHIDILTAHFVQRPEHFDVVVASNLFGDILSDLGPLHRNDRHSAVGQPQSRSALSVAVRTGARVRSRHRGPGHREPDRTDLERLADARLAWPSGRGGQRARRNREGAHGGTAAGTADTRHRRPWVDGGSRAGHCSGGLTFEFASAAILARADGRLAPGALESYRQRYGGAQREADLLRLRHVRF